MTDRESPELGTKSAGVADTPAASASTPPHGTDPSAADPRPAPGPARSSWRHRLASSLREFVIIVAGVLVALAAQAWWEGVQEGRLEADYLDQLRIDGVENLARLDAAIEEDSIGGLAADSAMLALEGELPGARGPDVARWLARLGQAPDFQPVTGAHRALQETGDLRYIGDDDVRHALTTYAASLDQETARLDQIRGNVLSMIPQFARRVPSMRLVFVRGPRSDRLDLEALRRDPEVAAIVFSMQAALENRLAGLRRMRASTHRLLDALGGEVDGAEPRG